MNDIFELTKLYQDCHCQAKSSKEVGGYSQSYHLLVHRICVKQLYAQEMYKRVRTNVNSNYSIDYNTTINEHLELTLDMSLPNARPTL